MIIPKNEAQTKPYHIPLLNIDDRPQIFFAEDAGIAVDTIDRYKPALRDELMELSGRGYALWFIHPGEITETIRRDNFGNVQKVFKFNVLPSQFVLDMEDIFDYVIYLYPNNHIYFRKKFDSISDITVKRVMRWAHFYDEDGYAIKDHPEFLDNF